MWIQVNGTGDWSLVFVHWLVVGMSGRWKRCPLFVCSPELAVTMIQLVRHLWDRAAGRRNLYVDKGDRRSSTLETGA